MSKDQKKKISINVETVENLQNFISWISSTLSFWKLDTIFPCNLIKKCCDDSYTDIENILLENKPF